MIETIEKSDIIERLNTILAESENILVKEAIEKNMIPMGYSCSYVPEVLLSVGKLFPVRVFAPNVTGTESADSYMSSVTCSYTRSLLESFMDGHYKFIKGWIFTSSCDHLRRLYDNFDYLQKPDFNHLIDVPRKITNETLKWYLEELEILCSLLGEHFDIIFDESAIMQAIDDHNGYLQLLKSIGDFRKEPFPKISGTEFHAILTASQRVPRKMFDDTIAEMKKTILSREKGPEFRARLLVAGSQLDDSEYIKVIESQGGLVVADRFCTGSIPGLQSIEVKDYPLKAVAEHTLSKISCPRMMEAFDERVKEIVDAVEEYSADGVVLQSIKFCDIWGVEASLMVESLRKEGIPVLRLEREYKMASEGQLRTRVQAFLESMGK